MEHIWETYRIKMKFDIFMETILNISRRDIDFVNKYISLYVSLYIHTYIDKYI